MKLCLYQPDGHWRRPGAPTSSERPKRPQAQPRDSLKLEAEGPSASRSAGGSYGAGGGSGGPYQQQVLHLVLGFVASGGRVLKRKDKGAA